MKKVILTGIDFSECSINALEHAISIANKADADVCMVWVNRPVSGKEIYLVSQDQIVAEAITRFEVMIDKYQPLMGKGKLFFKVRKGKIYREIVDLADELDAFLVVIGTHGASGFEELWMGSNAFRIVSAIQRPIVSIRAGVDIGRTIKTVVMPIDSTVESRQKTPMTASLPNTLMPKSTFWPSVVRCARNCGNCARIYQTSGSIFERKRSALYRQRAENK